MVHLTLSILAPGIGNKFESGRQKYHIPDALPQDFMEKAEIDTFREVLKLIK